MNVIFDSVYRKQYPAEPSDDSTDVLEKALLAFGRYERPAIFG
jgi:hypothetical protein